jgi:glycosyltransferase involved in cell wall biosynthesis
MNPKRILIFSLAYHPVVGGAEIAVKEITDRTTNIGFDMITMRFDPSHKFEEQIGNVHVYRIAGSKSLFPFRAYLFAKKLHLKNQYSATWSIMANWAGFSALFFKMKFPNVKFILTLQEGDPIEYIKKKVRLVYPIFKNIFQKADTVQAISNFLGHWSKDMGFRGQVEVIPNGVDIMKFENHAVKEIRNETVLITTSRLVEKNGVGDIIESLEYLPESVSLKILGVGQLESSLKSKVKKLNLENRVDFVGFVNQDNIPKYLHDADIFIRPSLSEGMGNSFIEAMAAGLPVIATNVGGIPDFLTDGVTGLFVGVHNPKDIASKIERLISDPNLRTRLISNSKKMVNERYDWDLIAGEMKSKVFNIL